MVATAAELIIGDRKYPIKAILTCKDCGIYVAVCSQPGCEECYVGKTSRYFSLRFDGHRFKWISAEPSQGKDDTALLDHYRLKHPEIYEKWRNDDTEVLDGFDKAFKIYFVDSVGKNLTVQEDFWKTRLKSSVNRCNIILPTITN